MLSRCFMLLAKASTARKVKAAVRVSKEIKQGRQGKVPSRLAKVEQAMAASHFNSIRKFAQQAKLIDASTMGRTRALKLLLRVLKKDGSTPLNEKVSFDQVRLLDYRSGQLRGGLLPRSDCILMAKESNADLVEVAKSPDKFSVCLLTAYRTLVLADVEAHLYKEQQKAENIYSKARKILPIRSNVVPSEVRQKAAQVVTFLTSRYSVLLQIIHIPASWQTPLYDTTHVQEDDGLTVQSVSKSFKGHKPMKDPLSVASYEDMESIEEEIRTLVEEDLKDHPKNPKGQTLMPITPIRSSYMGKPLLLVEYSLTAEIKGKKKRARK